MIAPTSPAELLREFAPGLISDNSLDKPVTPETAEQIGKICGNGADFWLRLQADYDKRMA